jgi:hypothetical protein
MNRRRELLLYFVLAFLLSWLPWPLVALNADSSPMVPFGPLIAAVIVAALSRTSGPFFASCAGGAPRPAGTWRPLSCRWRSRGSPRG